MHINIIIIQVVSSHPGLYIALSSIVCLSVCWHLQNPKVIERGIT